MKNTIKDRFNDIIARSKSIAEERNAICEEIEKAFAERVKPNLGKFVTIDGYKAKCVQVAVTSLIEEVKAEFYFDIAKKPGVRLCPQNKVEYAKYWDGKQDASHCYWGQDFDEDNTYGIDMRKTTMKVEDVFKLLETADCLILDGAEDENGNALK